MVLNSPMLLWAGRDVLRRPFEAVLLGAVLAGLVFLLGTSLLLSRAMLTAAESALKDAPSIVIRRVNAGGWAPVPVDEALRSARSVPGVVRARARIWGTVRGPEGALTIIGVSDDSADELSRFGLVPPARGFAVIGPGVAPGTGEPLQLSNGATSIDVAVAAILPPQTGITVNDAVLLHPADARHLLGLSPGVASDIAVDVFHDSEIEAIIPDLTAAFAWPVHATTKTEALGRYSAQTAKLGGLTWIVLIPALIALALLVAAAMRDWIGRRQDIGLLKALGWTTPDIVRLQIYRALFIGLPALAAGVVTAYGVVFQSAITWPGALFLEWTTRPPALYLDPSGAGVILAKIAVLILLPYLAAATWPALSGASADPVDFLEGGNFR